MGKNLLFRKHIQKSYLGGESNEVDLPSCLTN